MGKKKLIILGASGHGKVILDIALLSGYEVLGFLDDNPDVKKNGGYPVLGPIHKAADYVAQYGDDIAFIIGIGSNRIRKKLDMELKLPWATLIHPRTVIGRETKIGEGTVIMANAVVNPSAIIGRHNIVNTGAIIEHDNTLGDYVHVSPGAVLAGTVTVGDESHIGAGAVIKNNKSITNQVTVGAGACVVKDITESGTYVGVPAVKRK